MDTVPAVQISAEDKYTAAIELSNACRQFYKSRVEAAQCFKSKWEKQSAQSPQSSGNDNDRYATSSPCDNRPTTHRRQRSSIDEAMDKLRTEMSSLMDQDLSLMKQLLTLNETIEDLKWQRRYYCTPSRSASSTHLLHSDCSLSDTDMYESDDDLLYPHPNSTTTPATTLTATTTTTTTTPQSSSCRRHSQAGQRGEKRCSESQLGESAVKVYHGEQDSFDSGIHESSCSSEEEVLEASV